MNQTNLRCLVTAGPTREYIDPVRFISNPSSGKMGYAIAEAAQTRGWKVDLVSGPVQIAPPENVRFHAVVTGDEMFNKTAELFENTDLLIMCAAVVDMKPRNTFAQKQKKDRLQWTIEFEPVVDILKTLSGRKTHQTVVGFAAETENIREYAQRKMQEKDLHWIVANDVSQPSTGFESDNNRVELFCRDGSSMSFGPKPKKQVAASILKTLSDWMDQQKFHHP